MTIIEELHTHQIELELQNEDLRELQVELELSRKKYVDLYDHAPVAYLTISDNGVIQECNQTAAKLLLKERSRLIGSPFSLYIVKESQDEYFFCRRTLLKTQASQDCILSIVKEDGAPLTVQVKMVVSPDVDGENGQFRVSLTDITRQQNMEKQLQQKSRHEALGALAGGLAHNFNNHMAITLGYIELAGMRFQENPDLTKLLDNAKSGILRSRETLNKIITYCGLGDNNRVRLSIANTVKFAVHSLQLLVPEKINICCRISPDLESKKVLIDATAIREALLHTCHNAVEALSEEGEILVTLDQVNLHSQDTNGQGGRPSGAYLKLSVEDKGCGMAPEVVDKVFDPFFTTRNMANYSGLGLAVTKGIVESHNGFIKIQSAPDQGTTVVMYFPLGSDPS